MVELQLLLMCIALSLGLSAHQVTDKQLRHQTSIVQSVEVSSGNRSRSDNYWTNATNLEYYGDLVDVSGNKDAMLTFRNFSNQVIATRNYSPDKEAIYAVENFFWGKTNGIVLELGAVDGVSMSESLQMEKLLGWHRILIEGDPSQKKLLRKNSNSLAYSCAVCENSQMIHYVLSKDVGGIVEYMSETYMKLMYSYLLAMPKKEWKKLDNIQQVLCIPLRWIFRYKQIAHVNFFILDVEGGELEVLRSIDFEKVRFDVISVETDYKDRRYRPPGYVNEVTTYLAAHGYKFHHGFGRNSWFVHQFFTPSSRPSQN